MADRRDPNALNGRLGDWLRWLALGGILLLVVAVWVAVHAAAALDGTPAGQRPPANPFRLIGDLLFGKEGVHWSTSASVVLALEVLLLVAIATTAAVLWGRRGAGRKRPDRAARWLASRKDLAHMTETGSRAKADRLGIAKDAAAGVPIGRHVTAAGRLGAWLYSSWEDMIVVVAGPRTMKSTAMAIPPLMAAPGAALATSNKRDVVDATRGPRAELGRVWVFDPQDVANEPCTWWWNPLTYIAPLDPATGRARRDAAGRVVASEERAEKLAGQFVASSVPVGARTDAYFDTEGENLISLMLLAAAVAEEPITTVYRWLTVESDETPIEQLRDHGFALHADSLFRLANLTEKQRDGLYGTARARLGFLRSRAQTQWITPPAEHAEDGTRVMREEFHPAAYATSNDTLYLLSREGKGSAGPLVAALTLAVIDALQEVATAAGGRLPVPFLGVLDEAANICRFRDLDSYYSFFGSQGIIIMTILQNWAQGEEVWGVRGMEKLWSAANVKVYGGGVDDDRFLRRMSDLIGTHTYIARSESATIGGRGGSWGRDGVNVSQSVQERTILTVGELRELPQGRAVAFASGTPAVLIEPQPWFRGEHAGIISASLETHRPRPTAPSLQLVQSDVDEPAASSTASTSGEVRPITRAVAEPSPWDVEGIAE